MDSHNILFLVTETAEVKYWNECSASYYFDASEYN